MYIDGSIELTRVIPPNETLVVEMTPGPFCEDGPWEPKILRFGEHPFFPFLPFAPMSIEAIEIGDHVVRDRPCDVYPDEVWRVYEWPAMTEHAMPRFTVRSLVPYGASFGVRIDCRLPSLHTPCPVCGRDLPSQSQLDRVRSGAVVADPQFCWGEPQCCAVAYAKSYAEKLEGS